MSSIPLKFFVEFMIAAFLVLSIEKALAQCDKAITGKTKKIKLGPLLDFAGHLTYPDRKFNTKSNYRWLII